MKKYKINPNTIYKVFEDEVHILDHKTATIHTLNQTASFIWMQLISSITKSEIIKKMQSEFDASKSILKKDLEEFLDDYVEKEHILIKK